jgi:uncharacterized membrane protein
VEHRAQSCETLLKGPLIARYYYVFAVDYDKGGSWSGDAIMCTRDRLFTIRGLKNCQERGYQKTGFFEVDTRKRPTGRCRCGGDLRSADPVNGR